MQPKKLSDLTFKMNHQMTSYFLYLTELKERLDDMDEDSLEYQEINNEFNIYKNKFIKEFQTINSDVIDEYERIKDET